MSQESEFSEDLQSGWIQWFCGLDDHQFFCEVDEEFIKQKFNLYGLKSQIKRYQQSLQMILRKTAPEENQIQDPKFLELYQEATELYGLIHARYIKSPIGLSIMRQRYLQGKFGQCPRVLCEKQNVIPIAISEDLKLARVKVYCARCQDIYSPKKKFADVDGAFFGTSFPQLLLMTYPDIKPLFKKEIFEPTIFGFKIVQNPLKQEEKNKMKLQNMQQNITEESKIMDSSVKKKNKNKKR